MVYATATAMIVIIITTTTPATATVMAATTTMETTTDAMTVTTIAMMEIEVGTTTVDGAMTMAIVMSLTCHHHPKGATLMELSGHPIGSSTSSSKALRPW
jgi:hypothetical protein